MNSKPLPYKKQNVQNWNESLEIGAKAVHQVCNFLNSEVAKHTWLNTELVHNVEEDPRYQGYDIDLLWVIPVGEFLRCYTVEVKGDRNHETGNFFFETVSVEHRQKPGAFIISRAEWFFYYFVNNGELYCLPMDKLRPWFVEHEKRFPERRSHSENSERKSKWSTLGRIVPIRVVLSEVKDIRLFRNVDGVWKNREV